MTILLLSLAINLTAQPNSKWAGTWKQSKYYSVIISDVTETTFSFAFDCYNGRNLGQAEGTAIIKGNEAISRTEDPQVCKIKFIHKDDYIEIIDIRENDCHADAGNGVYYDGEYKSDKIKKTKSVFSLGFDRFWNDFQAAIINKDAKKVADMIEFPLMVNGNWSDENKNKSTFISKGFDGFLLDQIAYFKGIKLSKKSSDIKKTDATSLFKEYYPEEGDYEWAKNYMDIIKLTYGDGGYCSNWCANFFFAKVNGNYKLVYYYIAG